MYSSNYCLTIHMGSMHSDEKQYQCEYCGMKFAWKKCYERHISSVHLQLKNYKCETCGTMFARKEHLRTHQKRHDREAKWTKVAFKVRISVPCVWARSRTSASTAEWSLRGRIAMRGTLVPCTQSWRITSAKHVEQCLLEKNNWELTREVTPEKPSELKWLFKVRLLCTVYVKSAYM